MKKLNYIEQLERTIELHTESLKTPASTFEADALAYYQRAGRGAAFALLERMQATIDNGGHRGNLVAMLSAELAKLPTLH